MANNANTLYNRYSRYVGGGVTEVANDRVEWWERTVWPGSDTDIEYTIESVYEGRLDLIASVFFNEPRWWWVLAQYNSFIDPIAETTVGNVIRIPSKTNLGLMLSEKQGGYASTKEPVSTISPAII